MKTMLPMAVCGPALVRSSDGQRPGPSREGLARRPRNIQQARRRASPGGSASITLVFAIDFRPIVAGLTRAGPRRCCAGQRGGAMLSPRATTVGGGFMRIALSLGFALLLAACTTTA